MQSLVIGYGSIGRRHARLLTELGCAVAVVSSQNCTDYPCYTTIKEAVAKHQPHYVVVASITSRHSHDLLALREAGFSGVALIEKPLFMNANEGETDYPFTLFTAYNLRFHPITQQLKAALSGQKILAVSAYVGQHLSQWRPGRDVKDTYSAHKAQGGGVVRDLSHELDLAQYLFGDLTLHAASVARVGDVTVDSEDVATLLMQSSICSHIHVHMNYLDTMPTRWWYVITEQGSYHADLIACTLSVDGQVQHLPCAGDASYRAMHQAIISSDDSVLCTYQQGLAIMDIIATVAP